MSGLDPVAMLEELGSTAGEIAENLRKLGIKGTPRAADCCPLANFLKAEGVEDPEVHDYSFSFYCGDDCLPDACIMFVQGFDFGRYPDLIEAES